jgi:hypothetical protein
MATCTVNYSEDVVRRAVRAYFWRRFKTPLGLVFLSSFVAIAGFIWIVYSIHGANWMIGAFGSIICLYFVIEAFYYFSLPKAAAKRVSEPNYRTAQVETSRKGIRVVRGPNALLLRWDRYKHIWLYDDFVLLAVLPPLMIPFMYLPTDGMSPDVRRDLEAAKVGFTDHKPTESFP